MDKNNISIGKGLLYVVFCAHLVSYSDNGALRESDKARKTKNNNGRTESNAESRKRDRTRWHCFI
jgi:hypothetical protein